MPPPGRPPRPSQPSPSVLAEAREWMMRAQRDLQAARNELAASPPLPEMTAYHSQQAAEKALKAFLTLRSTPFRSTHDLVELLAQCQTLDTRFAGLAGAAQTLSPYGTQFRYPSGPLARPVAESQQALRLAETVLAHVTSFLQA